MCLIQYHGYGLGYIIKNKLNGACTKRVFALKIIGLFSIHNSCNDKTIFTVYRALQFVIELKSGMVKLILTNFELHVT